MAIKTGYVPYPACVVPADRVTGLIYSNYGMVHAKDIIGSRSVPDLPTLYQLSAGLLSEDGEGANAVGQLWYVASEKAYYTLTDWSKKDTSAGWTKGIPGVSGESSGGSIVDTNTTYAFSPTTKDNTIGFEVTPSEGDPTTVELGTFATINNKSILDGGNITTPDTNTTYSIGAAKTTDDNTIKVTLTGSDKVTSSAGWEFRTINKNSIIGSGNITIPDTNTTYSIGAAKTTDENTIGVTLTDSNNVASSVGWEFKTINGNSVIGSGNIAISTPDQVVKKVENTGSGTVVESVKLSNGTLTVTNRAESPITITDAGPTEIATAGEVNVLTAIKASGHAITKTSRTIVLPGAIPDKDITNIIAPTAVASYGFHGGPASDLKPMCVTPCSPVIYKITKGSSTMKEGEYYLLDTSNGYFYECWSPGINGANAIRQGDRIDRTTSDSSLTSELAFMVVGDPTLGNPVKLVKLY